MPGANQKRQRVEITIAWTAIFKVLLGCLLALVAVRLWPLAELLLLALLIAIALKPLMQWTRRRHWPRWAGVLLSALLLLGSAALAIGLLAPTIGHQGGEMIQRLPAFKEDLLKRLPASGPLRESANQLFSSPSFSNPEPLLKQFADFGERAAQGIVGVFVVLIVAIYFVADGERVYEWLLAFLPEKHRRKMGEASEEIASVVGHYMIGQFITSVLCAVYAFFVLSLLHVPNALLLAALAGIFDVLPLVGFFLFAIPAVAMALTVSSASAGLVGLLYIAYHFVENYFIVPKVYGNRLRLSTLTVLISCLAAGMVAGVVGVIIILPIVASYPIVERLWLRPYLECDTLEKHEKIDDKEQPHKT